MSLEVNATLGGDSRLVIEGPAHLLTIRSGESAELLKALSRQNASSLPAPAGQNVQLLVPIRQPFRLEGLTLPRGSRTQMTLHMDIPKEARHLIHTVSVRQLYKEVEVGRLTWQFRPARRRSAKDDKHSDRR